MREQQEKLCKPNSQKNILQIWKINEFSEENIVNFLPLMKMSKNKLQIAQGERSSIFF